MFCEGKEKSTPKGAFFILDSDGIVVVEYKYNAWGEHKVLSPDGAEITDETHLGYLNPHRYRGYYYSDEMGLYYLKSRFYDPEVGRFLCVDSLDYLDPHTVGGVNLFAYCNNNPVMNVDPTGCWSWSTFWKGVSMVAVGVTAIAVSVATFGAATPLAMTAVAAVTATAGALTAVNGVAEVVEAATDYNFVEEVVFQGNEAAYDTYAAITEGIASVGTAVIGVYNMTGYAKAVKAGRQYLGNGYSKYKDGIWRSKDGFRQMRLDKGHLNIELFANPLASKVKNITMMNAHIYYQGFRTWTEIGGKAWFLF